jgi:hypothetical protein
LRIVQEANGTLNISALLSVPQADSADAPSAPDIPEVIQREETSALFGLPFALLIERLQVYGGNIELEVPALPGVRTVAGLEVAPEWGSGCAGATSPTAAGDTPPDTR